MYQINRKIEIDAGHRIKAHASKCRNLHGHRYSILLTISSQDLINQGSQTGMVMDFSFVKDAMKECIDSNCDHAIIVDAEDNYLIKILDIVEDGNKVQQSQTALLIYNSAGMKIYIVPFSPTAEALAKHWYEILSIKISTSCSEKNRMIVESVRVYETPNCWAEYPAYPKEMSDVQKKLCI
ncbi:MAG: 6-carboxytetrahydropterin synthase [Candidatus Dasytiphilus stammeri]